MRGVHWARHRPKECFALGRQEYAGRQFVCLHDHKPVNNDPNYLQLLAIMKVTPKVTINPVCMGLAAMKKQTRPLVYVILEHTTMLTSPLYKRVSKGVQSLQKSQQ